MLGLYGQIVMAIPSKNAVVVSMGKDLRPIEPVRLAVYPAIAPLLNLTKSLIPPLPKARCGETLECLGTSAQCYTGLPAPGVNHSYPTPGGFECKRCFQNRVMDFKGEKVAQSIWQDYCKIGGGLSIPYDVSDYVECLCFNGDDPFLWVSTTTSTPAPGPEPYPPKVYTTTTRPSPSECRVPASCLEQFEEDCGARDGGTACGNCLRKWWVHADVQALGCEPGPHVLFNQSLLEFCYCGTVTPKADRAP